MLRMKDLFSTKLKVVNLGLESFGDALRDQAVETVHVDWQPPAGGDAEMLKLLEKLGSGA